MINKISKLLALAEGASTAAEAEACFARAQALASAHAISLAEARANTHNKQHRDTPIHKTITIGELRKRANKHLIQLMSGLARVNDVELNIASNSTYVILFGYSEDIATCEELWIKVSHKMVESGEKYLSADSWRSTSATSAGYPWRSAPGPVSKQTARSSYYTGFIASLSAKLLSARKAEVARAQDRNRHQANTETNACDRPPTNTALALRKKADEVSHYYRTNSTARGTWSGSKRVTAHSASAMAAGRRDGQRLRVTESTELPGGPKQVSQ